MSMRSASPSLSEVLDECASLAVGGGIITMTLFPFALPCIALVGALAVGAGLLGLAIGVIAGALAAPLLLARRVTGESAGAIDCRRGATIEVSCAEP